MVYILHNHPTYLYEASLSKQIHCHAGNDLLINETIKMFLLPLTYCGSNTIIIFTGILSNCVDRKMADRKYPEVDFTKTCSDINSILDGFIHVFDPFFKSPPSLIRENTY